MITASVKDAWSSSVMAKTLHSPQRYRGFVLTTTGLQKLHEQIQQLEVKTRVRQSPRTIAERVQLNDPDGIHPITVRKILNGENGVDKRSLQVIFKVLQLQLEDGDYAHAGLFQHSNETQTKVAVATSALPKSQDWSETTGRVNLFGRLDELTQLNQAILNQQCRLIQILGVPGVGKTALATMLTRALQPKFEFVIWKSLHHAPAIQTVLTSILQVFAKRTGENIELPTHVDELKGLLIEQLQKHRCLLVLDHFNSILCNKQYAGYYRQGYEAYGELLQSIAESAHQSCLVITSREKPRVAGIEESHTQSLQLDGLSLLECQQICSNYTNLVGSTEEWRSLIERCDGNPLILKTIVAHIHNYFDGGIFDYLQYLKHGRLLFSDLRDLLSQQFERLSSVERELVYRLALQQKPISISQFREEIINSITTQHWLEGLDSLSRRSLLQRQGGKFNLDRMMKTYVNECLIEQQDNFLSKPKLEIVTHQHTVA
jgi:hypothetical protein